MHPRTKLPLARIVVQDRQRQGAYPGIDELADSMRENGLIQPIVVNQDCRLIAGGRRVAAAQRLGWTEIDVVFRETLSEDELQVLELEENTKRESLTWQEQCLAVAKIHMLKQNTSKTSWGERETGELFGIAKGKVNYTLRIARALRAGHEKVRAASSITDALRILLLEQEEAVMKELASRTVAEDPRSPEVEAMQAALATLAPVNLADGLGLTAPVDAPGAAPTTTITPIGKSIISSVHPKVRLGNFANADCINWLGGRFIEDEVDAIVTDPPYGIDVDMMQQTSGGLQNIDRIADTHQVEDNLTLFQQFVPLAYKILRPSGFLAMWCDIMRWQYLYDLCIEAGFQVQRWPIVWIKTSPCINQVAHRNFTKNVEFVIIARKDKAFLAKPAATCCVAASNAEKLNGHPFTKPPEVWKFLYQHLCLMNQLVVDPFMGVGSSVIPALDLGLRPMGCEIDAGHHAFAIENVKSWYLRFDPESTFVT